MRFPFNVRVYGSLIRNGLVLITEEEHEGRKLIKFPGGGMEFGEGPADTVVREFYEETGLRIHVVDHIYTTHFFQLSAFDPRDQIISIYYLVDFVEAPPSFANESSFEIGDKVFRWKEAVGMSPDDFTLPIDKYVVPLIRELADGSAQ